MAENRVVGKAAASGMFGAAVNSRCLVLLFALHFLLFTACASTEMKREIQLPEKSVVARSGPLPEPEMPDFMPVTEEVSPLKTRLISLSARNTPLRDVLHTVTKAAHLNLMMEKGVDPETPITVTLEDIVRIHREKIRNVPVYSI